MNGITVVSMCNSKVTPIFTCVYKPGVLCRASMKCPGIKDTSILRTDLGFVQHCLQLGIAGCLNTARKRTRLVCEC